MATVLTELGQAAVGNKEQEDEVSRLKAFMRRFGQRSRRVVRGGVGLMPAAVPAVAHMVDSTSDPAVITLAQRGVERVTTEVAGRLADSAPPVNSEVTDVGLRVLTSWAVFAA